MSEKDKVELSGGVVPADTDVQKQGADSESRSDETLHEEPESTEPDETHQPLGKGRLLIVLGVVLAVIGLGGWSYWFFNQTGNSQDGTKTKTQAEQAKEQLASSEKLRAKQDYDGAKAVWQATIDGEATEEERYKAYRQIGALDETKGDYAAAIASYLKAVGLTKATWRPEYEALARCYEKSGDKANALKYYELTLKMYPDSEQYVGDRRYYTKKIERLKLETGRAQNG